MRPLAPIQTTPIELSLLRCGHVSSAVSSYIIIKFVLNLIFGLIAHDPKQCFVVITEFEPELGPLNYVKLPV